MVKGKSSDGIGVTVWFVFLVLVSKLFRFLLFLFYFSSQDNIRLNSFGQIEIPNLNFRQEAGNYRIVAFGRTIAIDGSEADFEPFDIEGEGREHDLMMDKEIAFVLLIDIDLKASILFFLASCKVTILPATIKASVSLI